MAFLLFAADPFEGVVELTTPIAELSWVYGRPLEEKIPELIFAFDAAHPFVWPDFLRPAANIPLVSPRMRAALQGVEEIEYFPARLVHRTSGEQRPYFAANVLRLARAMDKTRSQFVPYEGNPDIALNIDRLVVDDLKLGSPIARLAEFDLLIVIADSLKATLEAEPLVGLDFVRPEDWDGFRT